MSMSFTKLFSSITESTIWIEDDHTRIVWITMLAMADRKGRIWASIPGLANRARVPDESVRVALKKFMSPDPDSRTKTFNGKRIEEIDGGWRLLNYEKYRAIRDEETIRESKRKYINNRRKDERVENVDRSRPLSTQAEAEAEAEAGISTHIKGSGIPKSEKEAIEWASMGGVPPEFASELFHQCEGRNWVDGAGQTIVSWRSYSRQRWVKRQSETAKKATAPSVARPVDLKIILEAKKTQADELKAKHRSETATGSSWGNEQARQNYLRLRGEIKELIQKIGALA